MLRGPFTLSFLMVHYVSMESPVVESVLASHTEGTRQYNRKAAIMSHYYIEWREIEGACGLLQTCHLGCYLESSVNQPSCAYSWGTFSPSHLPSPCAIFGVPNWPITWNISFSKYDTEVHRFLPTQNTLKLWLQIIPVKIADLYDSWGISYFNLKPSEMVQFCGNDGGMSALSSFGVQGQIKLCAC